MPALPPLFLLLGAGALQAATPGSYQRLTLPAVGAAGDDGPEAVLVNPASLGFDPDPGYALLYRYGLAETTSSFQATGSVAGLGVGVSYAGNDLTADLWTIDSSLALRLSDDLALGANLRWNLPEGEQNNFTSWDLGLAYRPLSWLGFGASAINIGSPGPAWGVTNRFDLGVAFRPFGDRLTASFDGVFTDDDASQDGPLHPALQASLQGLPMQGLLLRAYGTTDLTFGVGVQVYFGREGVGMYGHADARDRADVAVGGALLSRRPETRLAVDRKRVALFEVTSPLPYSAEPSLLETPTEDYLHFLKRVRTATEDPGVRGIIIRLGASPFSLGQVEEVRELVDQARASGKPVVVFLDEEAGNGAYFLATAADRIYLHPAGELGLTGLSAETLHLRGTLDLLGVEPQFFRRGQYKSAVETYTRREPSDPASEQMNALLDDFDGRFVAAIAAGRNLTEDRVRAIIDEGPYPASRAVQLGLVDGTLYETDLEDMAEDFFASGVRLDDEYHLDEGTSGWKNPRRIAVVVVDGTITGGESTGPGLLGGGSTGAKTVVQALEQAREDRTVKAVVLRVDSPGGSSQASDEILHAVQALKEEGKPVIVSMGGTAASGGYYIAAAADVIYAQPTTVTGSIGVYGGKFSTAGLYEKLGLSSTLYTRGRRAGMWSTSRPFDAQEELAMDQLIDETYQQFKSRVAEGRQMSMEQVEERAQGRVWSGTRALQNGLVDETGGFFDAVERARIEAGLKEGAPVDLITYGDTPDLLGELPTRLIRAIIPRVEVPAELGTLQTWSRLEGEPVLMMMPYNLEVR